MHLLRKSILSVILFLATGLVAVALITPPLHVSRYGTAAGSGVLPPDPAVLAGLPVWQPEAMGYAAAPIIDLRFADSGERRFPEPGRQRINDCVGWAAAYAKSYQEAVEHGWIPDAPARSFSPSFIYNQVNGGVDRGAYIHRALELLGQRGAATLATMPYTTDFRRTPPAAALAEAPRYRIRAYYLVTTPAAIKQAIQQGHPVIVGIVTDQAFMSGRFDIYDRQVRAGAIRNPLNAHGRHAMVIVGYDDIRQAFLFQNSWGTAWGQEGMAWIAYDVVDRIAYSANAANFLEAAYIMIDERTSIPDAPQPKQAEIRGRLRFAGLANGQPSWTWNASIAAADNAFSLIESVAWRLPSGFQARGSLTRGDAAAGFAIDGSASGSGTATISAVIRFKDGSTLTPSFPFRLATPQRGALAIGQVDRYFGKIAGRDHWDWTVRITGSLNDLGDISRVTWHLHPSFPEPNRVVTGTAANGFAFTTRGWGTFPLRATVTFKDGSTRTLSHGLRFRSPPQAALSLANSAVPYRVDDNGRTWYTWTAFLKGPEQELARVAGVTYLLHPSFRPNRYEVRDRKAYGFPFSATGWGSFELVAEVRFADGTRRQLKHRLVFQ